eukprot:gene3367-5914_t
MWFSLFREGKISKFLTLLYPDAPVDVFGNILTKVFHAEGKDVNDSNIIEGIDNWVTKMFSIIDKNTDGKITREEMHAACEKDSSLIDEL